MGFPVLRRFQLHRDVDINGVSGTGVVAEGVEFEDGSAAMRWSGEVSSVVFYDAGMPAVARIHGHDGATRIVFLDAAL
jgi:hypothetical protein